jgi:hypothetical protein
MHDESVRPHYQLVKLGVCLAYKHCVIEAFQEVHLEARRRRERPQPRVERAASEAEPWVLI